MRKRVLRKKDRNNGSNFLLLSFLKPSSQDSSVSSAYTGTMEVVGSNPHQGEDFLIQIRIVIYATGLTKHKNVSIRTKGYNNTAMLVLKRQLTPQTDRQIL